jgi:hypothetical protein
MTKKVLLFLSLFVMVLPHVEAYEALDCSSDVVFDSNSCDQCFDGGTKVQGDYI